MVRRTLRFVYSGRRVGALRLAQSERSAFSKAARPPPLQSYGAMNREESDSHGPSGPGT